MLIVDYQLVSKNALILVIYLNLVQNLGKCLDMDIPPFRGDIPIAPSQNIFTKCFGYKQNSSYVCKAGRKSGSCYLLFEFVGSFFDLSLFSSQLKFPTV